MSNKSSFYGSYVQKTSQEGVSKNNHFSILRAIWLRFDDLPTALTIGSLYSNILTYRLMIRNALRKYAPSCLVFVLVANLEGQRDLRTVVLPARIMRGADSGKEWRPTKAEMDSLETNLSKVSSLKADGWGSWVHIDRLTEYFRQYVPIVRNGKKEIYVNAFCRAESYWREQLVDVSDGGTCYWQVYFDPLTKTFSNLTVNGRA